MTYNCIINTRVDIGGVLMHYRLVIADDEPDIREGLADFIDWDTLGFQVIAKFEDGRQVIEYLQNNGVDVILTDIKMTFCTGLDIARHVFENKLKTKVILLSGYKEFDFARQAIKYNVANYLSKPTDIDEVTNLFENLKIQLDNERKEKESIQDTRKQVEDMLPLLQEQFIMELISGILRSRNIIEKRMRLAGLHYDVDTMKCCQLKLSINNYDKIISDTWKYGREGLYNAVRNMTKGEKDSINYTAVVYKHNYFLIIAIDTSYRTESEFKDCVSIYRNKVQNSMKVILNLDIEWEILGVYPNLMDMIDRQMPAGSEITASDFEKMENLDNVKEMSVADKTKNNSDRSVIKRAKEFIHDHFMDDILLEDVTEQIFMNPAYFSRLFKQETGENFSDYLIKIRMEKAIEYLKMPQYKIYEISAKVGYRNIKYFYKLFKKYTGLTPTEYRERGY
jgi:two-component system response regulator YesN